MAKTSLLISTGDLGRETLAGQAAVITGAGGGIGYEAARALCWLGARVAIAEIDARKGRQAAAQLLAEFGPGSAVFIPTDVGDESSVRRLAQQAVRTFGKVDIVINNATITPLGAVLDRSIAGGAGRAGGWLDEALAVRTPVDAARLQDLRRQAGG